MKKLQKLKSTYDKNYFEQGIQSISDVEYDILETCLNDDKVNTFEIPAKKGKVKLPVQMWSLNKIRNFNKINRELTVLDKLDGVSCLMYENKAFTRGNGIYGYDISNMFKHIFNIKGVAVRGELVIKKDIFKKKYEHFSNTRTMVCSYVNKNTFNEDIEFVAYELININLSSECDLPITQQLDELAKHGLKTVYYTNVYAPDQLELENTLNQRLHNSQYDIDGLVLCFNDVPRKSTSLKSNPTYSVAFKQNFKGIETVITDITWNLGKSGNFVPVLHVAPVVITGSTIKKISGHNISYIKSRGLGIGAAVEVVKAGQVIPFIVNILKKSYNFNIPQNCNADGTISDMEDVRIKAKKIVSFAKTLGIVGIGPKKAEEFVDRKISPINLICDDVDITFLKVGKTNTNILKSIERQMRTSDQSVILLSSGVTPVGIGPTKVRNLLTQNNVEYQNIIEKWKNKWIVNFRNL